LLSLSATFKSVVSSSEISNSDFIVLRKNAGTYFDQNILDYIKEFDMRPHRSIYIEEDIHIDLNNHCKYIDLPKKDTMNINLRRLEQFFEDYSKKYIENIEHIKKRIGVLFNELIGPIRRITF
jgi:hypothetical protein